jgi:acyl-CoA thioester hydrolase
MVLASACGSGRFILPDIVVATPNSSGFERTVAKDIRGVKRPEKTKGWMMTTAAAAKENVKDNLKDNLKDMPPPPAPFLSSVMQIEPQWIDYNGHLNMAYYNVMMDRAIDEMWLQLGIGPAYMKDRHCSTFTAECHVRYLREIHLGDPVQISVYLLGHDEKRLHTFEELRHAGEGWLSATSENMTLHMDMKARKVAPFPPDIRARIQAVVASHAAVPRPEGIGRKVAMPSK